MVATIFPCAAIPNADRGSNIIVKLDTRTLPAGYKMTTENPRVVRLTPGKAVKMNFGADAERIFAQCGYEKQPTDAPSVSDVAEAVMYALTSTHNMRFNDITVSASSR